MAAWASPAAARKNRWAGPAGVSRASRSTVSARRVTVQPPSFEADLLEPRGRLAVNLFSDVRAADAGHQPEQCVSPPVPGQRPGTPDRLIVMVDAGGRCDVA